MLKKKEILERHITDIADIAAFSVSSTNHWHGHQDEPETFETSAQAFISIVQNFSGEITDMDGNPLPIHFSI
ncbi:MAG: hypothetical protein U9Q15_01265 [Patescibacteria group bacterium]|nr:hypothetical protein [Patescibacteria group bacterium]